MSLNKSVLIIQKTDSCNLELTAMLMELGFSNIKTMTSFSQAFAEISDEKIRKFVPQFMILDCHNQAEAADLIRSIMANPRLSEIKILVMQQANQNITWAFQLGAIGHLNVPFSMSDLQRVFFKKDS